jgi:membrane-bound lytic murein transglycosylase A
MKKLFNLNYLAFSLLVILRVSSFFWQPLGDLLVHYRVLRFSQLPEWSTTDLRPSFKAFQASCHVMMRKSPDSVSMSQLFPLKTKAWFPACQQAVKLAEPTTTECRSFFEHYFLPIELRRFFALKGLFTGYYLPEIQGSLHKTPIFSVPIYGEKKNSHDLVVYAWVKSKYDRMIIQIEGSGSIRFSDNKTLYLGYAGDLNHFVYFRQRNKNFAKGAQAVPLMPGYSMAIDLRWIPLGAPLWLSTRVPSIMTPHAQPSQRLMIAQDTGGAIVGPVRGDFFFGEGETETHLAKQMYYPGQYWILLPKKRPAE